MINGQNPEENSPITTHKQTAPQLQYGSIIRNQYDEARRSKQLQKYHEINMNRKYQQLERDSFPFGKQSTKISNYVVNQMNKDEENKLILEKFRLDAIRHRNKKHGLNLGSQPYLTQSMVPGINADPSKFIQKPQPRPYQKSFHQRSMEKDSIRIPKTIDVTEKRSVAIGTEEPQRLKTHRQRRRLLHRSSEHIEEEQAQLNNIKRMLKKISSKLKENTEAINETISKEKQQRALLYEKKRFFTEESHEPRRRPKIQYTSGKKDRVKTESFQNIPIRSHKMSEIKEHLRLLKKNRRRMQDLDQFVYR